MEKRTARLTLLVDPNKKIAFEKLCALEDVTPSQKIRQFMRDYIEQKLGVDWRGKVFDEGKKGQQSSLPLNIINEADPNGT